MRKFLLTAALPGILFALCMPVSAQRTRSNAALITGEQMRDYLTFVASDLMEGRSTPSHGLDTTALFISTLLKRWGAKPMGDNGSFYQHIPLNRHKVDVGKSRLQLGEQTFVFGEDYLWGTLSRLPGKADFTVSAPLVYVGDGWMIKSKDIDDYRGIDAKGKIVVVNYTDGYSPPRGIKYTDLSGKAGTDWVNPLDYARQKGALGIILLPPPPNPTNWYTLRVWNTEGFWQPEVSNIVTAEWPLCMVSRKVVTALFQGEKSDAAAIAASIAAKKPLPAFDLSPGKRGTLVLAHKVEQTTTQNIVAVFEGSDPALKNEYVAVGAHYDHIGGSLGSGPGDQIYNGADDDGSGTVALMAMAEALSQAPKRPNRSTLFVWHCGEEKGLWGSQYFTQFPTVPLKQIVTQLNIDMIGRSRTATDMRASEAGTSGTHEIYVIGSKMLSSELNALSEKVNDSYLKLHFNYQDNNGMYYRSDHYSYASKGIPIIFYCDGMELGDYHGPGDEAQKIDYQKMEKVTRTIYETLWAVSNLDHRPRLDTKSKQ